MKSYWLNKKGKQNLIIFFAGWSFDENPFHDLSDSDEYDVLLIYDYNNLSEPEDLKIIEEYKSKTLVAWSMGVFVAYLLKNLFKDFDFKLAVNGTITPVDDKYGIPVKIFELTLKHAEKGLEGKFYKNVFNSDDEFQTMYCPNAVKRPIPNRVSELDNLYQMIKDNQNKLKNQFSSENTFYDLAIVSKFDKIIPSHNQIASHSKNKVPVITLPYGHFLFYNFKTWDELIKCHQIIDI